MLCITRARTHGNYLKWTLIPLFMGRKRWKRYQNSWKNVPNMMTEKIWRFYVGKYQYARKRARMHVCAFFAKCLKWPETYAKWIWDDFEHFDFFLRALTRGRTHARAFSDLKIDRTDIDLNHDKYEWEMPFRYEDMIMSKKYQKKNTKWRLDDVMKTSWPWNVTVTSHDNDLWLRQNWTKLT